MKLLTTLRSFLNRDLIKQSLLAGFIFWLFLQIPLLFATSSYLNGEAELRNKENRQLLSTVFEETFKSNARFGDLVNTRGLLLKYGKPLGLVEIGICQGSSDIFSKMNENNCLEKSDYTFDYLQGDTKLQINLIWSKENRYDKVSYLPILFAFSLLSLIFTFSTSVLTYSFIVSKIKVLSKKIARSNDAESLSTYRTNVPELNLLVSAITFLQKRFRKSESEIFELKKRNFLFELSEEIAHDIRSPLSALNMVTKSLDTTDEKRNLIKGALQRINDIADRLLSQSRSSEGIKKIDSARAPTQDLRTGTDINEAIVSLIKEKQLEFQENSHILIKSDLEITAKLNSSVNSSVLLRVLSNLINNSAEAISDNGTITVSTRAYNSVNMISIMDDGAGIPEEILQSIGQKGFTSGKENGNGLGIYQAKKSIEEAGGTFDIQSRVGVGTMLTIKLPAVK